MSGPNKRVAVIGGGIGGLHSIKGLKDEGIEPVCFEKTDDITGIWKYREQDIHGLPSVMWTTTLNHSKEFSMSDFLVPKDAPNYLRHDKFYQYLQSYADEFDLRRHILFNREVVNVNKTSNYDLTGRWSVCVKNILDGNIRTEIFDGVFVCVGFLCYPKIPAFPGMEQFLGDIIHTHSLKRVNKFVDQRVAIIGTGCSGVDAAVEISGPAKQVYLSVRTPTWILPRVGPHGMPFDFSVLRRYLAVSQQILPLRVFSWFIEQYFVNNYFDHRLYGLEPKYPLLFKEHTICDGIASKLLTGVVLLRKGISRFTSDGVIFEGEEHETQVDSVIMATGYTWNFDFLEKGTLKIQDGKIYLYKCVFPTNLKHPTLAIIGFVTGLAPGFPIGELQVRWAAHLIANNKTLPDEDTMTKECIRRYKQYSERYCPTDIMMAKIDYVPYCDELASEFGAKPNFWKMAFTDPKLFIACIFGPCIPAQYRLVGPNKWAGAREAILTASERMQTPLSAERLQKKEPLSVRMHAMKILLPLLIICILFSKGVVLKYYICGILIPCYILINEDFSRYFIILLLLPFFFNKHGFIVLYILTFANILYVNSGHILVNNYFWT